VENLLPAIRYMMPIIRLLHILFGVFWVGSVFFQMLILEPRLRILGPKFRQPVMSAIMPILVPAMMLSGFTVFFSGILMTLAYRGGRIDTLLTSGWGLAMVIGFVATVGAMLIGLGGLTPTGIRLGRLGEQLNGQPPTPEQAATISRLSHRMELLSRADFTLLLIALVVMPLARYF
jgi:hypothetical protein